MRADAPLAFATRQLAAAAQTLVWGGLFAPAGIVPSRKPADQADTSLRS